MAEPTWTITNVVDLDRYRRNRVDPFHPDMSHASIVRCSTLDSIEVNKRVRSARAFARRLAQVDALAERERAGYRRRGKGGQSNVG